MEQQDKKILEITKASIYSPDFYRGLLDTPLSWSMKYFFSLALILAVVSSAAFGIHAVPAINSFIVNLAPNILKYYPAGLEVSIKNGVASSTVAEPYFIKIPTELASGVAMSTSSTPPENLMVIDTKETFKNIDQFNGFKTWILLSKDALVSTGKNGGIQIQPLKDVPDMAINKKQVELWLQNIAPLAKFAIPIILLAAFAFFFLALSIKLVYLFFLALLVLLIAKIKHVELGGYKKAYQIGLHAMTAAILVEALLQIFLGVKAPFLFTIISLLAVWFNLDFETSTPEIVPLINPAVPATPAKAE